MATAEDSHPGAPRPLHTTPCLGQRTGTKALGTSWKIVEEVERQKTQDWPCFSCYLKTLFKMY